MQEDRSSRETGAPGTRAEIRQVYKRGVRSSKGGDGSSKDRETEAVKRRQELQEDRSSRKTGAPGKRAGERQGHKRVVRSSKNRQEQEG
jgi:hypothetical protein